MIDRVVSFVGSASLLWAMASAIINVAFWFRTPEGWIAFCDANPKLAPALQFLRAMGCDPKRGLEALKAFVDAHQKGKS